MTPAGEDARKLVARIPEALLATLRSHCEAKASVSLLGRIHGKHPGLKALTAWARETLHPTLALLSLKSNNVFEITFDKPKGRTHALNLTDLVCESAAIYFSSWRPHFDPKNPRAADTLDHPIWVQIVDLCQVLREETSFLQTIGEQLGQVISIDTSDAYKAKLYGPRIRLLVKDLNELPHSVEIPRLDGDGTVEYALEYSGLPNQCGRCRSRDHQVRHCPKKDSHNRKAESHRGKTPWKQSRQQEHREAKPAKTTETNTLQQPQLDTTPPPQEPEGGEGKNREDTEQDSIASTIHQGREETIPAVLEEEPNSPHQTIPADEINFPKLPSPSRTGKETVTPPSETPEPHEQPHFVWSWKPPTPEDHTTRKDHDKGKNVQPHAKTLDSTPITRQGYRTGRLVEDFWLALKTPNTPTSSRKTLQVIPFLIKDREPAEYLVNIKTQPFQPIARVLIAELLAGVP